MQKLILLFLSLACLSACAHSPTRHSLGSAVYAPGLAGDVTGTFGANTVSAVSGSSPITITPNSLQWVSTAAPNIAQAQQANASAPNNLAITPQAPGASATNATNGTSGSLLVNVAVPVNSGTEGGVLLQRNAVFQAKIAAFPGSGGTATDGALWLQPNITPSSSNYTLAGGNSFTTLQAVSTVQLAAGGTSLLTGTSSAIALAKPLTFSAPPTIACGTGGTQTVPAGSSPGLLVTSGTLSSNCTVDFSTNATTGYFVLDMSGVTLGATFGVNFKNGTSTSTTITSSNVLAGATMAHVWTHGTNTLSVSY